MLGFFPAIAMASLDDEHSPITFSDRLVEQDSRLDALLTMWEEAQIVCADLASRPEADLLSFAHEAAYFSVVDVKEGYLDLDGNVDATTSATPADKPAPTQTRPQLKAIESPSKGKNALKATVATPRATTGSSSQQSDVLSVVQDQDTQEILDELLELEGKRIVRQLLLSS